jgi:hypothetical protein
VGRSRTAGDSAPGPPTSSSRSRTTSGSAVGATGGGRGGVARPRPATGQRVHRSGNRVPVSRCAGGTPAVSGGVPIQPVRGRRGSVSPAGRGAGGWCVPWPSRRGRRRSGAEPGRGPPGAAGPGSGPRRAAGAGWRRRPPGSAGCEGAGCRRRGPWGSRPVARPVGSRGAVGWERAALPCSCTPRFLVPGPVSTYAARPHIARIPARMDRHPAGASPRGRSDMRARHSTGCPRRCGNQSTTAGHLPGTSPYPAVILSGRLRS